MGMEPLSLFLLPGSGPGPQEHLSPCGGLVVLTLILLAGWCLVGGAVFGCGGFEAGVFAPALWTWGSTTHWSSLIWLLGRPRTATHCEYSSFTLTILVPLCLPLRPSLTTFLGSYVCSRSGHILEIDHQRMAVQHTRRLLPMQTPGSPLPQKQTFSSGMWPSLRRGTSPDAFTDASFPQALASPSAASVSPRLHVLWDPRMATCASGPWTSPLCSWKQVGPRQHLTTMVPERGP